MDQAQQQPPHLLSVTEAARHLSCSRGHVYNLIAAGELRAVNIGTSGRSKTRIYDSDLIAYITRRTRGGPLPDAYFRVLVASAPELTAEQGRRLAELLPPPSRGRRAAP